MWSESMSSLDSLLLKYWEDISCRLLMSRWWLLLLSLLAPHRVGRRHKSSFSVFSLYSKRRLRVLLVVIMRFHFFFIYISVLYFNFIIIIGLLFLGILILITYWSSFVKLGLVISDQSDVTLLQDRALRGCAPLLIQQIILRSLTSVVDGSLIA